MAKSRGPYCEHGRGCNRTNLTPQFTKAIKDLVKGEREPHFYCEKHAPDHPDVSPISGLTRIRR